ncbi:glycosyltransferase family 25 protein [Devosia sp. 2618]|uniref:glycosyltransferase family 25 protein n=1 Tax=Devosia sp. 2618 TaxID=3156454 RepID=UPI00339B7C8D
MRIYYINMASRPDRRLAMEEQLQTLGLTAERVEAVTPQTINPALIAKYCDQTASHWQTPPELSCSLSHRLTLQRFLETADEHALILEDDALLSTSLPAFLAELKQSAPPIDLLRIETDMRPMRLDPKPEQASGGLNFHRYYGPMSGSAGYIVNRKAAKRLIEGEEVLLDLTDRAMFMPFTRLARDLIIRQSYPALVVQYDNTVSTEVRHSSDLESVRADRQRTEMALLLPRWRHNLRQAFDREVVLAARKAWHQHIHGAKKQIVPFQAN